jgi:hypothetical protein
MSRWFAAILTVVLALAGAGAQAASPLHVIQTVDINAPPTKVWGIIGGFDQLSAWHPVVASSPADKGNTIGSVRTLTLKADGNPGFTEKLTKYNAAAFTYSYDITPTQKVLPVIYYHATIKITPTKAGSKVTWRATFKAAPGAENQAAIDAITGVFRGGLDNLKTLAEK